MKITIFKQPWADPSLNKEGTEMRANIQRLHKNDIPLIISFMDSVKEYLSDTKNIKRKTISLINDDGTAVEQKEIESEFQNHTIRVDIKDLKKKSVKKSTKKKEE